MAHEEEIAKCFAQSGDPEKTVLQLIKEGLLEDIGKQAIAESHIAGVSPVIMLNGKMFRLHPDGSKTPYEADLEHLGNIDTATSSSAHFSAQSGSFYRYKTTHA